MILELREGGREGKRKRVWWFGVVLV